METATTTGTAPAGNWTAADKQRAVLRFHIRELEGALDAFKALWRGRAAAHARLLAALASPDVVALALARGDLGGGRSPHRHAFGRLAAATEHAESVLKQYDDTRPSAAPAGRGFVLLEAADDKTLPAVAETVERELGAEPRGALPLLASKLRAVAGAYGLGRHPAVVKALGSIDARTGEMELKTLRGLVTEADSLLREGGRALASDDLMCQQAAAALAAHYEAESEARYAT